MNKLFYPFLVLLCAGSSYAQQDSTRRKDGIFSKDHFYIQAGTGYATAYGETVSSYTDEVNFKVKNASFTSGMNATAGVGYMINKYIGVELDNDMIFGGNKYKATTYLNNSNATNVPETITAKTQFLDLLMPGLALQLPINRFTFYTRMSLVLPVADKAGYELTANNGANYALDQSFKYTMRFTLGYSEAIGLRYQAGRRISIWAEASALSFAPYLKTVTMTSSSINGVSNFSSITDDEKVASYAHSGSYTSAQSTINPTHTLPYSNVGIKAGIAINLGDRYTGTKLHNNDSRYFYLKGGLGYAFPAFNDDVNTFNGHSNSASFYSSSSNSFHNKATSFSTGLSGIIGGGYMLNNHFGVELDANVTLALKKYHYSSSAYSSNSPYSNTDNYNNTSYAQLPGFLLPAFVLQTGGAVLNIYSRLGIALPGSNTLIYNEATSYNGSPSNYYSKYTFKYDIGYTGAAGAKYSLSKHVQLWAEVSVLSYNPEVKQIHETGASNYNVSYQNSGASYIIEPTSTGPQYVFANKEPTFKLPYSNLGIQAGVAYRL